MLRIKKVKTLLLCMLVAICFTLLPVSLVLLAGNNASVTASAEGYTSITAELADTNYKAVSGATTLEGLKKNIIVTGVTQNGAKVVLSSDEYSIELTGGATISVDKDTGIITNGSQDDKNGVFAVKCGSLADNITISVTTTVPYLKENSALTVEINLAVEKSGTVTDDHTADTIHKILKVTGTKQAGGSVTLTPDLYTVKMNVDDLYGKSSVFITVTAVDGIKALNATAVPTGTQSFKVTPATLLSVELSVKSKFTLASDGKYKDDDGKDAFIVGANHQTVFSKIDIIAVFANGKRTLTPKFTSNTLSGTEDDSDEVSTDLPSKAGSNEKFSVTVTRDDQSSVDSNELTITFAEVTVIGIKVNDTALDAWNDNATLYPYTSLLTLRDENNKEIFAPFFTIVFNDGSEDPASSGTIEIDGSLAPLANTEIKNNTYSKTIKIVSSVNKSAYIEKTIKNINYVAPTKIALNNTLGMQILHHAVDYSSLNLKFTYGRQTAEVPLEAYKDYVTATVYGANEKKQERNIILSDSVDVGIIVAIDDLLKTDEEFYPITTLVNETILLPTTDLAPVTYTDGCHKVFEGFDKDRMVMEVFTDEGCSTLAEGVTFADKEDGYHVNFSGGGTYYVKVSLKSTTYNGVECIKSAADGNYYPVSEFELSPESATTGVDFFDNGYRYTIEINFAPITLTLTLEEPADGIHYGDSVIDKITVSATSNGQSVDLGGESGVPYQLIFKRNSATFTYADLQYEDDYTVPNLNAGTYKVYAVSKQTKAYLAGKVRENYYITVTIKPKEIDSTSLEGTQNYDRTEYKLEDFFPANPDFLSYDDGIDDVFTEDGIKAANEKNTANKFYYADTYTVTVTLNKNEETDGDNYNYCWKNADAAAPYTKKITVKINHKTFSLGVTLDSYNFYYGDVSLGTPKFTGEDTSYFAVKYDSANTTYYKYNTSTKLTDPLNDLDVGKYDVKYTVVANHTYNGKNDTIEADTYSLALPTAKATFEIEAAQLNSITVDGDFALGSYLAAGYEKTLNNWNIDAEHGLKDKKAYEALTFSIAYTDMNGAPQTTTVAAATDGKITFTDAGTYVVKISLSDKTNCVWLNSDSTTSTDDITFTFTIKRAEIAKPTLSANTTYDGTEQDVTVTNWNTADTNLNGNVKYTVKGQTLAAVDTTPLTDVTTETFKVKWAGGYEVKFSIINTNNYCWEKDSSTGGDTSGDTEDNTPDDTEPVTLTYTVNQAEFNVKWTQDHQDFEDDKTEQKLPDDLVEVDVAYEPDNDNLIAEYTIYTTYEDGTYSDPITKITAAGTYYLVITGFDGVNGFNKENYKLTENALTLVYSIVSQGLEIPVLKTEDYIDGNTNTITVTYKGGAYLITDFLVDPDYDLGGNKNARLSITISVGSETKSELKDVIVSGNTIGSYTVTVTPALNYQWKTADGAPEADKTKAYTYTVIINKHEIEFDWNKTEFTYDGNAHTPTATAKGLLNATTDTDATVKVEVGVSKTNAGVYDIDFADLSLTGDRAHNYALKTVEVTQKLTIERAVVAAPSAADSATFDGTVQTITFTLPANTAYGWNWANVDVTLSAATTSYDKNSGVFTFYHSGTYTLTFNLPEDGNVSNYCWVEGQKTVFKGDSGYIGAHAHTITVDRMEVKAPELGANRAIEHDESGFSGFTLSNDKGVGMSYAYGLYDDGNYTKVDNLTALTRTVYYVKLTFNPTAPDGYTASVNDYYWTRNTEDTEGMGYLTDAGAPYGKISEDGLELYLCFIVTKTQIKAEFAFAGYVFGANGWYKDGETAKSDYTYNESKKYISVDTINAEYPLNLISIKEDNNVPNNVDYEITVAFFTDPDCKQPVLTDNIVNGLPWNAGNYYARITIDFDEELNWEDFPSICAFTVTPRPLVIKWGDESEAVYNGQAQTRTVTIVNMRYSSLYLLDEIPALTVTNSNAVNVLYVGGEIAAYKLEVTAVDNNNYTADGYTVEGSTDPTSTFTIKPMKLTVSAKEITYTYGNSLDFLKQITSANYGSYYNVTNGTVYNNDYDCIELEFDKTYASLNAGGEYYVKPRLKNTQGNYELIVGANGKFKVEKRKITVTYSGAISHTYGDELALNNDSNFTATTSGGNDNGIYGKTKDGSNISRSDVFRLYLAGRGENATATVYDGTDSKTANASTYTVSLEELNTNYEVILDDDNIEYTINPAAITATATGKTGVTYKAQPYNYIGELIIVSATVKNNQSVSWYITPRGDDETEPALNAEWTDITEATLTNATKGVYWIKATAPNHSDKLAGSVTIEISKATLTVKLDLEIYYGEENPANYDGAGKVFLGGDETDLSFYTVTGLLGSDTVEVISGTFTYATNYTKGNPVGNTYTVTVSDNGNKLTSDNYIIQTVDSRLTVKAPAVTVTFNNSDKTITESYWSLVGSAFPYADYFTVSTEVTSTYDRNSNSKLVIFDKDNLSNIFTISTDALTITDGEVSSMNNVGEYDVRLNPAGGNYDLGELPEGTFVITGATFTVTNNIADIIDSAYNESEQSLKGSITIANVKNESEQTIIVTYVTSPTALNNSAVLDKSGTAIADYSKIADAEIGYTDVGEYYVYFIVKVTNHDTQIISKTIEIVQAQNSFEAPAAVTGWIYGLSYDNKNTDGYTSDNLTAAETKFKRVVDGDGNKVNDNEVMYYLLAGNYDLDSVEDVDLKDGNTDIVALFESRHKAGNFNAGDYTLYYVMEGTANYTTVKAVAHFSVEQRELTVTADALTATYGNSVTEYTRKIEGYAYVYDTDGNIVLETVSVFGENAPVFGSEYTVGKNAATYAITKVSGADSLDNYTVTYITEGINLTVNKRNVAIRIESKASSFAYYPDEQPQTLTYTRLNDTSFYSGDGTVIELYTSATVKYTEGDVTFDTNAAGTYPIFAVFTDGKHAANYTIEFYGTLYQQSFTPQTYVEGEGTKTFDTNLVAGGGAAETAGVYTIKPAELQLLYNINEVYWSDTEDGELTLYENSATALTYDGKYKGYVANVKPDEGSGLSQIRFYALYGSQNASVSEMTSKMKKEPGTYSYYFVTDNTNYTWSGAMTMTFTITAKGLDVNSSFDENTGYSLTQTYDNATHQWKFVIDGLVTEADYNNVKATIGAVKPANTASVFAETSFNPFTGIGAVKSAADYSFTFNLLNAGIYTVEIKIEGNANYSLDKTYTLTINRNNLVTVSVEDTTVQYGTEILDTSNKPLSGVDANRFGGFNLVYGATINEPQGYFITSGVTYLIRSTDHGIFDPSEAQAGWRYAVTPGNIVAYNYDFSNRYINLGTLEVIKRNINVTLKGYEDQNEYAQAEYDGVNKNDLVASGILTETTSAEFLDPETNWFGAAKADDEHIVRELAISLTLTNALNVGTYNMAIRSLASNYNVTFTHRSGETSQFEITKKALTITAVVSKSGVADNSIVYGDSTDGYFSIKYAGLVDKDKDANGNCIISDDPLFNINSLYFTAASVSGSTPYAPWSSHAGARFNVTPRGLTFTNYSVRNVAVTMTVVSRAIKVETNNLTYTEKEGSNGIDYNGGVSGIYHIAPVNFSDLTNPDVKYNVAYNATTNGVVTAGSIWVEPNSSATKIEANTKFSLTYGTSNNVNAAPVVAGATRVKITLNSSNSDFVLDIVNTKGTADNALVGSPTTTSVTFNYTVNKKVLEFDRDMVDDENTFFLWTDESTSTGKRVTVSDYINDIMEIVSVHRISNKTTEVLNTQVSEKSGYYAVEQNGLQLAVYPGGVGIYVITVVLNEYAAGNYEWISGTNEATVQFTFAAKTFSIKKLSIADWVYLGYNDETNKITIENSINLDETAFAFTYAQYTGTVPASVAYNRIITDSGFITAVQTLSYRGMPTDAGTYILKAEYRGEQYTSLAAYCVFRITPKVISVPQIEAGADSSGAVYDSQEHTVTVNYDSNAFGYTYATLNGNGNAIVYPAANKVTITAVNADTYVLSFTISNTRNYKWAENVTLKDGAYQIIWTIAKATNYNVSVNEVTKPYGESYEVAAESPYDGEITYEYAVREDGKPIPSASSADWKTEKPVNAGNYWIRALCAETANFKSNSGSGKLTINKVTLTATPEGNMTYGDDFDKAYKNIVYTGWTNGELTVTENIEYTIDDYDGTGVLTVMDGGYVLVISGGLTLPDGTDAIYGFEIDNYDIVIENGVFTVNKKDIEVTLDNLSSVYGEEFDETKVQLTTASLNGLVVADRENAFEALSITPTVLGNKTDGYYNAQAYVLSSVGHENSANYNVTVRSGIYTVEKLDVYVTVDAGGGEYGDVTPARKTGIYSVDGNKNVEDIFGVLALNFRYSGTANDGTTINNSLNAPELAGSYTAVARLNDSNFNLVTDKGTPSVAFIVIRKTINESEISVKEIKYNGNEQTPVIVDGKYSALYTAEQVAFVNVDNYTVKLTLKDANNYKWTTVEGEEYNLPFAIVRGDNEFVSEVVIVGWIYGDEANIPETETLFGDSSTYVYTYSATKDGEYTSTVPALAGTYWVKVTVPQSDNYNEKTSEAVSFEISKRAVSAPTLEVISEGENANTTYTGERLQSAVQGYDRTLMRIIYEGDLSSSGDVAVFALNAGEYKVYFALNDADNYTWADGTTLSEGNAQLIWTVAKADDNEVSVFEVIADYGESYEVSAESKYGGDITYVYAVREDGKPIPSASSADWKTEKPVNAGNYWIKAVCAETSNFKSNSGSGKLTINKVTLTATPEGNMTYGDDFDKAYKNIVFEGWINGDSFAPENVVYAIDGYDGTGVLTVKDGGYVLIVNGDITISEGTDATYGFEIDNYDIVIENGVFTVNKKDIEVTLDNLSSVYGEEFDETKVQLTSASLNGLVGADRENAFEALSITPTVLGNKTDGYYNAQAYVLSSAGHENSANYNVTVRSGIYTVEKLDVYVTVDAGGGEYGDVTPARKTGIYSVDGNKNVEDIFGVLALNFRYSGTANDGTTINNSLSAPELAGSYTAVARLNDSNFNLVTDKGTPSVAFIVNRKTINESEISVKEIKYNGNEQSPVIVDGKYSALYTAEQVAFVNVDNYTVKLTLEDANNYKWTTVEGEEYNLPFAIVRGDNEFVSEVVIVGWIYGDEANIPETQTLFGDSSTYVYTYSATKDGEYTSTVPTLAGTYWVKVTVPQSDNYNEKTSEAVSFEISKRAISAPTLEVISEGDNANTTYTGERLQSAVQGYDRTLMRIIYEGDLSSSGDVAVFALNAGEYKVYFALNDADNYTWADGTTLSEGNAQLIWTVARMKIAKPTMPSDIYMVNGGTLTFTPDGYDGSKMLMNGNTTTYGGVFKVTVSIRDTVNFEWLDGSIEDISFDWVVVGWDTVFIIVVSVLGAVAGVSAIAIGVQYSVHKHKKLMEAVKTAAAEQALHESVAAKSENGNTTTDKEEQSEKPSEEEKPAPEEPAEQTENVNSGEVEPESKEANDEGEKNNE